MEEITVEQAFENGTLYLIVDAEVERGRINTMFEGERGLVDHEKVRLVHVISKPAGGEIRGYVLARGKLHLRLPCYTGEWPEMDAAVQARA